MEIYILDSLLRRQQVVDKFESLVWSERFSEIGDFELVIRSTRESRGQFTTGTLLAINLSYRLMMVETVEDNTDEEGRAILNVKGRSLEALLEDRVARGSFASLTAEPQWVLTGTPGNIARKIFNDICVTGTLDPGDRIPFITPGDILPESTIPEPSTAIRVALEPVTVYQAIKDLCDKYDLGFRLVRNFDASQLYFNIYSGSDRTTRQTVVDPVIFALNYDNLQNSTELTTVENAKNVAYVFSDYGSAIVFPDVVPPDVDGMERRVLLVEASSINADTPDVAAALQQIGKEELAKARGFAGFDGEINQRSAYRYGVHYELGDIVEMRNADGVITYKRVTEQIFVSDQEGERAYPTLAMNMFLAQNTWLSETEREWVDFTTEQWIDM